jgi:hypothetical protein
VAEVDPTVWLEGLEPPTVTSTMEPLWSLSFILWKKKEEAKEEGRRKKKKEAPSRILG